MDGTWNHFPDMEGYLLFSTTWRCRVVQPGQAVSTAAHNQRQWKCNNNAASADKAARLSQLVSRSSLALSLVIARSAVSRRAAPIAGAVTRSPPCWAVSVLALPRHDTDGRILSSGACCCYWSFWWYSRASQHYIRSPRAMMEMNRQRGSRWDELFLATRQQKEESWFERTCWTEEGWATGIEG